MTPAQLEIVEEIFHAALDCETGQLKAFLDERCAGDEVLRRQVEQLLAAHRQAGDFIETPVADLPTSAIADGHEGDLLIGQTVGHYKISKRIGAGGMGAVYLAERADQQYEKLVAIKLIKRGMDTDSVLRHFRNERQILATFDHPNIARLLDGGATESGLPYFVMEYVEGLPIDQYCEKHAFSITERLKLFREVCAAVAYAHRHTIIHRDIKPSNVVVTSDGTPKLLDFGIAKILQPGAGMEPLATMTGLRLMTPEYASPEQVRGQPVTTATDVYSLGVVLYQLLTGQKPYRLKTRTTEEISRAIIEQEPTRPSTAVARSNGSSKSQAPNPKLLRGDLDNIVLMALRKQPERRYQSVEQFSEDIRRHLEALPVRARNDTLAYRSAKFVRRNTAATVAAALVFLTLLGGIIATTWETHKARTERARAERRFNDVRQLAHSVLFDYHDEIKTLPGATKVRERLVRDALNYLDSLAGEAGDDPALQRELAAAYERVAEVRGSDASGSLGDRAGAAESDTKALKIHEALVALNPNDMEARSNLARVHRDLGLYLSQTEPDPSTGFEHLRKARALYVDLTRQQPANEGLQFDLANTCTHLGMALEDHNDLAEAIEEFRAAASICEALASSKPHEQRFRHALWASYEDMSIALSSRKDIAGAMEANEKGRALGEALVMDNPLNADYRRGLVLNYEHAGDFRSQSDERGALEHYRKAIESAEQLVAADPANVPPRRDLARSQRKMAESLARLRDNTEALSHFSKALAAYDTLATGTPADSTARLKGASCRAGVAAMHARLGHVDLALGECGKTLALLKEITEDGEDTAQRTRRAAGYEYLGYAYDALAASPKTSPNESRQRISTARDMFRQSLNILDELSSRGALDANDQAWAKEITGEIAKCGKQF